MYLRFKNKITNIKKEAKVMYYKTELHKFGNNIKLKLQLINNIVARNSK